MFGELDASRSPDAALEVAYVLLSGDGRAASLGEKQRLEPQGEGPVPCMSRLSLQSITPGTYLLAVSVEDLSSGERVWKKARLQVD